MSKHSAKLLFVQEAVYYEHQGKLFSSRIKYETYWKRFLDHFDHVTVLARVKRVDILPEGYGRSDGPGVNFIALDYYNGQAGFFKKRKFLRKKIKRAVNDHSAFVLRIPGLIGALVYNELKQRDLKYSIEVVGDPFEVGKFLPLKFPFKIVFRYWSLYKMRRIVKDASAALYVTKEMLQKRYPINAGAFNVSVPNVIVPDDRLVSNSYKRKENILSIPERLKDFDTKPVKVGVVGMLYSVKSPLEIVRAIQILLTNGLNVEVNFAGDGPLLKDIKKLSSEFNIERHVICHGILSSGDEIFSFLDSIDLYLQFSKTEGMPRAMIEAMSRGCPVIASKVGGIPEIIPQDLLVKSGDIKELSGKIKWILTDIERMQQAVDDNIRIAKEYTESRLNNKRNNYYSQVHKMFITN